MKAEEIKELFDKHCSLEDKEIRPEKVLYYWDFITAIKEAELEWYKKEQIKLNKIIAGSIDIIGLTYLMYEINEKIKELGNS